MEEWKKRVRQFANAKTLDKLTLENNFRSVLDDISNALVSYHDTSSIPASSASTEHGTQRLDIGFDIHQLILEYKMLRHALQDCAERHGVSLDGIAGHVLHEIIDGAGYRGLDLCIVTGSPP